MISPSAAMAHPRLLEEPGQHHVLSLGEVRVSVQ